MFNKEESIKNTNCKLIGKINFKRIGTFILTMSLISSLSGNVKAEDIDYHEAVYNYYKKVEEYSEKKEYDENFIMLYHIGRFVINGNEIKPDRVFIVAGYLNNELCMYLYTSSEGKRDFLSGKEIELEDPILIPLRQTTLFQTLLEKKLIIVHDRYMNFDLNRISEINEALNNWNGLAHSLTPETDAIENKVFIERDNYEKR